MLPMNSSPKIVKQTYNTDNCAANFTHVEIFVKTEN